jgi:hypothetical protein
VPELPGDHDLVAALEGPFRMELKGLEVDGKKRQRS